MIGCRDGVWPVLFLGVVLPLFPTWHILNLCLVIGGFQQLIQALGFAGKVICTLPTVAQEPKQLPDLSHNAR